MDKYKIEANEKFFENIIEMTNDNGVYGWPDQQELFAVKDKKLHPFTIRGYMELKKIVSPEWLKSHVEFSNTTKS